MYIYVSERLTERFYAENGLPPYGALSFPLRRVMASPREEQVRAFGSDLFTGLPGVRLDDQATLRVA